MHSHIGLPGGVDRLSRKAVLVASGSMLPIWEPTVSISRTITGAKLGNASPRRTMEGRHAWKRSGRSSVDTTTETQSRHCDSELVKIAVHFQ